MQTWRRKSILVSAKSDQSLRAEAKGEFKAFPKETIHQVLRITGVVVEDRIDEAAVKKWKKNMANWSKYMEKMWK